MQIGWIVYGLRRRHAMQVLETMLIYVQKDDF